MRPPQAPHLARLLALAAAFLAASPAARADQLEQRRKLEILALKIPENLDLSRTRKGSVFQLSYAPELPGGPSSPVPLRKMHAWKLRLVDLEGRPVRGARLSFDGRMPQHSHPFPALP